MTSSQQIQSQGIKQPISKEINKIRLYAVNKNNPEPDPIFILYRINIEILKNKFERKRKYIRFGSHKISMEELT